jgi:hypothetical protein
MNSERPNLCSSWFYLGLFLLCMSVLMLQIVETRDFVVCHVLLPRISYDRHGYVRNDGRRSDRIFQTGSL